MGRENLANLILKYIGVSRYRANSYQLNKKQGSLKPLCSFIYQSKSSMLACLSISLCIVRCENTRRTTARIAPKIEVPT